MYIEPKSEFATSSCMSGFYKFEKYKTDINGNIIEDSKVTFEQFPNLITDFGLNDIAVSNSVFDNCYLGSGSIEPAVSQTTLQSYLGTFNTLATSSTVKNTTIIPYYIAHKKVYRFNAGNCTGNISEVGIGRNTSALFSRSLITNNGIPVVITKLSEEVLDVTYELRLYPNITDVTGTITFTGNKGATHQYTMRPSVLSYWESPMMDPYTSSYRIVGGPTSYEVYDGIIGTIFNSPAGNYSSYSSPSYEVYVNNSMTYVPKITVPLDAGNFTNGIRSCKIGNYKTGIYQIQYDPPIMKTSNDIVILRSKVTWGRKI